MKIIWIDGTFGSGKTAVANAIVRRVNNMYFLDFDALQEKYKPNCIYDFFGKRYPEAKRYLIDALRNEIFALIQGEDYDYIIIPIALINDYCNQNLVNTFADVECYHFILTVSEKILYQRIENQENRDVDLAKTYFQEATMYLKNNYPNAVRIDTSDMNIDSVAEKIIDIIK